ncbi:hypothetical protein [Breznakia pachnodae]|uniref:Dihydroorotate dehydrogenase n=1 Tax=Breznakia pachnodae TaxID=265178 RepID=A0ABU0E3R0_9FIRM|nr:hypothetical protein [Breznakia pachnodae]MDQ0361533.1 dihydroorotate dehydrogenase [Breznakia pachnodae]
MNNKDNLFDISFPLIAAAGPYSGNIKGIKRLYEIGFDYITTKTITDKADYISGSIAIKNGMTFNKDGFSNINFSDWIISLKHFHLLDRVIVSIFSKDVEEAINIACEMEAIGVKYIELCCSCPTFGEEPLCFNEVLLYEYCKALSSKIKIPIIVKLLLSTEEKKNRRMVEIVKKSGCHAVSVTDCLPIIEFDDEGKFEKKGMTGDFMKFLVLKFLEDTKEINFPKIAIGGVSSSRDCINYFKLGAIGVGQCACLYTKGVSDVIDTIKRTKQILEEEEL